MILVTGGAGYIGSVTSDLLTVQGEGVVVLDNLARGHRESLSPGAIFYEGNIGDRELVVRIAREHSIDACIHFAAYAYVGESVSEPARYFENNVEQGNSLLLALLEAGVRRVVFSSTCATYGEPEGVPISEDQTQKPTNPYGWSKLFMERIMHAYDQAYGLRFVALRYFNAAGATERLGEDHDPEPHLIPNVLNAARGLIPAVSVFGNDYSTPDDTPVRDYVHVSDLASAHILALNYLRSGGESEKVNLGSGLGHTVLEVIEAAREVTQRPIAVKIEARRPGDPSHLVADATRAKALLGWRPSFQDLSSIIRTDWDWRMRHPLGYASSENGKTEN